MYVLVAISNVNIPTKGTQFEGRFKSVYTGDVLELEDATAKKILAAYSSSFHVHRIQDESAAIKEEIQPKPDVKLVADLQADSAKMVEPDEQEIVIPLEEDAHHSKVKAYVLDLEEQNPIDLARIRAVKKKFDYPSVAAECDRILEAHNAL